MYFKRWVESSGLELTVEGLIELFVKDSYFFSQIKQVQNSEGGRNSETCIVISVTNRLLQLGAV